ncbi:MAG: hypothetical protein M1825_003406 [Sarcosagium campestre]|nr:MAG: hypothetical protein M1825_003406 [Sarcosagium campestre]
MRGVGQFKSKTGFYLFSRFRNLMLISCIQAEASVPAAFESLHWQSERFHSQRDLPGYGLTSIAISFANLQAAARSSSIDTDSTIASELLSIDTQLAVWAAELPLDCMYITVEVSTSSPEIYGRSYHNYRNCWRAHLWNQYRCVRILVNSALRFRLDKLKMSVPSCSSLFSAYQMQISRSRAILAELAVDICASAPFQLRFADDDAPPAAAGLLMIWPLHVAASDTGAPRELKLWVAGRMEAIGHELGIGQAFLMAKTLRASLESIDTPLAITVHDE